MLIYDFLRKVQNERDDALREKMRLDNRQLHEAANTWGTRAAALHDVLTWAGFEDCDIATKREGS